jgi:flagellar hook assembly protein FlgD
MRRFAHVLALIALLGGLLPLGVAAAAATSTTVLASYDAPIGHWYVAGGSASLAAVVDPHTQGSGAAKISYDFSSSSSQVQVAPTKTADAPEVSGLPRSISLDVHGDGSWNVVYLQIRDASGEIFHYKMGNIDFNGTWKTLSIEPGRTTPATTLSGNGDKILDLPIQMYRVIVDKNPGGTKLKSSVVIDNLRYTYEAWSPLRPSAPTFVPSAGQSTTLALGPVEAGSVALRLTDELGHVRGFTGTAKGGGTDLAFAWNGKADDGTLMRGSVRARLAITRSGVTWTYGVPYLVGLPVRYEGASPGSVAGINARFSEKNTVDRGAVEYQARLMEDAWLRMSRESFEWRRLEPRQGWFEWAKFDQAVNVAAAHNIGTLGRLEFSADWASSAPSSVTGSAREFYPPTDVATFAAYARAVVHRYKDRIHVWEIWNEEDLSIFWKPAPSASGYATLLKAAYAAIKAEDPTAKVVMGGMTGFDRAFLDGVIAAGAWSSFDILGIHAYVAPGPEASMFSTWIQNATAYLSGKGGKPLWITEFGWSTYSGSGSSYIGVTETTQAAYLARAYLVAAQWGVGGIFPYELIEHGTSTTSKVDNYGLVETGGRIKPAYGAVRRVAEALDGGTVAGAAAPSAAGRATVASLDSLSGWAAHPLGGGSASIALTTQRLSGSGAMQLSYSFTSSSSGVELSRNLVLPGAPRMVSIWAYGDDSANPVYVKVADATGEVFQGAVGSLQKGWHRLVLYMDGSDTNWSHSGGDGDGAIDYPMTLKSVFVFRGGIGKLSGTAFFDDVQVESGPRVRGVVISRRGGIDQALYSLAGSQAIRVPVTGSSAWQIDGGTSTTLAVSSGSVGVTVGSTPINVLTTANSNLATISPNGDGVADSVTMSWIAGDRQRYTFQVLKAGVVVRNVAVGAAAHAGITSMTWDGLINGSPAPAGTYTLRLANLGPDGRTSYLVRTVTVQ